MKTLFYKHGESPLALEDREFGNYLRTEYQNMLRLSFRMVRYYL